MSPATPRRISGRTSPTRYRTRLLLRINEERAAGDHVLRGQVPPTRPPVIDMHVHSTNTTPQQALDRMKQLNIRYLFVSTLLADLPRWASALNRNQSAAGLGRGPYSGAEQISN